MRQVEGTSWLVTIAVCRSQARPVPGLSPSGADNTQQEDLSSEPVLKVWALDKPVKKTGLPTCLSTLNIHNGRKPFPVGDRDV